MSEYEFKVQRAMPVLPLRGLAVFPGMLLNFDVERPMSAAALNLAMSEDQIIFLTAQKDLAKDVPFLDDIYHIGTVCRVRQMLRQPGGKTIRVMVEGIGRGPLNIAGMPVWRDAAGGVGTPTSDNVRTRLTAATRRLLVIVNGYDGNAEALRRTADDIRALLRRYGASDGGTLRLVRHG